MLIDCNTYYVFHHSLGTCRRTSKTQSVCSGRGGMESLTAVDRIILNFPRVKSNPNSKKPIISALSQIRILF